jgi:Cdc6-like AAA superfamily ATPase
LTCEISLNLPNGNYMSYIRCPSVAEPYRIFSKIFRDVFSHQPPPSGISRAVLAEKLWTKLEKPLLVVLDDANFLAAENLPRKGFGGWWNSSMCLTLERDTQNGISYRKS